MLTDFLGAACDGDELVMEQGTDRLFCDENASGSLVWTSAADHEVAVLAAQKAAEEAKQKKLQAEKRAAEKAAAEKRAAEKAEAERKAAAEKKAAAKKKAAQEAEKKRTAQTKTPTAPKATSKPVAPKAPAGGFKNCSEARAAGAAPVYRGDAGYAPRLDRDGDGVGCE